MAKHVFKLPDVGEGVVEGEIVKWNVKPGDTVKEDEPLVELMTDKATVSIPSTVNGKVVSIASYQCKPGEVISVKEKEKSKEMVKTNLQYPGLANIPSHLEFDKNKLVGKVNGIVEREWVALQINELLIVEYYSRQA